MRFVPMRGGLSAIEEILLRCPGPHPRSAYGDWEFGRLVLDPRYRGGPELLQKCVFLAVSHLMRNFACQNAYASCNHALSRLYRRFGFSVVSNQVLVAGEERPYNLIRARVADVLLASATDESERSLARYLASA